MNDTQLLMPTDTEQLAHQDLKETRANIDETKPEKLSRMQRAWRLFLLISHYVNIITDLLTAREMLLKQEYYYFGILISLISISWLLSTWCLCKYLGTRKGLFLGMTHLDYAYCLYSNLKADPNKAECVKYVKLFTLVTQSGPGMFLSVHSIFVGGNLSLIVQLSVAASLLEFALTNALYNEYNEKFVTIGFTFHIKFALIYLTLESTAKLYIWGFFCVVTQPLGAWIFFPVSFVLAAIMRRVYNHDGPLQQPLRNCCCLEYDTCFEDDFMYYTRAFFWSIYFMAVFIGNLNMAWVNLLKFNHRAIEYIAFGIIFIIQREALIDFIASSYIWLVYAIICLVCIALLIPGTLCWLFYEPKHASYYVFDNW